MYTLFPYAKYYIGTKFCNKWKLIFNIEVELIC
jgi:hypothetical protein